MSRYESLKEAYQKHIEQRKLFYSESYRFANSIRENIVQYFECPPSQIIFVALKDNGQLDNFNSRAESTTKLKDDGFWEVGIVFYLNPQNISNGYLLLKINFKPVKDDAYCVKILSDNPNGKSFNVNRNDEEQGLQEISKYFYDTLLEFFENWLENFINQKTGEIRPIGFR